MQFTTKFPKCFFSFFQTYGNIFELLFGFCKSILILRLFELMWRRLTQLFNTPSNERKLAGLLSVLSIMLLYPREKQITLIF